MFYPLKTKRVPLYITACTLLIAGPCILAISQLPPGTSVHVPNPTAPPITLFSQMAVKPVTQLNDTTNMQAIYQVQTELIKQDITAYARRQSAEEQTVEQLAEFEGRGVKFGNKSMEKAFRH